MTTCGKFPFVSILYRQGSEKTLFLHVKKINDTIKQNSWRLDLPTVLRVDGFRFFFFSDKHLPLHIHVEKGDGYMRVELDTFKVTKRYKLSKTDEKKIITIIQEHQQKLIGAWDEYFNYKG